MTDLPCTNRQVYDPETKRCMHWTDAIPYRDRVCPETMNIQITDNVVGCIPTTSAHVDLCSVPKETVCRRICEECGGCLEIYVDRVYDDKEKDRYIQDTHWTERNRTQTCGVTTVTGQGRRQSEEEGSRSS
jgi:ribosomal protein S24E